MTRCIASCDSVCEGVCNSIFVVCSISVAVRMDYFLFARIGLELALPLFNGFVIAHLMLLLFHLLILLQVREAVEEAFAERVLDPLAVESSSWKKAVKMVETMMFNKSSDRSFAMRDTRSSITSSALPDSPFSSVASASTLPVSIPYKQPAPTRELDTDYRSVAPNAVSMLTQSLGVMATDSTTIGNIAGGFPARSSNTPRKNDPSCGSRDRPGGGLSTGEKAGAGIVQAQHKNHARSGSKPGDWLCTACQGNNFANNNACYKCRKLK